MRKKIIAGNWKMNKTFSEGLELVSEASNMIADEVKGDTHAIFAPPFIHLQSIGRLIESHKNLHLAAQNCSEYAVGAYTGEISAEMLASVGVKYVILGHSERRQYFNETNAQIAQKVNQVLKNKMQVIFCCGETLQQREQKIHFAWIETQLQESIFHLSEEHFANIIVAYEPIWAIGTGVTATTEQAQEVHKFIRSCIEKKYGASIAQNTSILYGGSCKPDNAAELFSCEDVDGGLIGGASLKSRDFTDIAKAMKNY